MWFALRHGQGQSHIGSLVALRHGQGQSHIGSVFALRHGQGQLRVLSTALHFSQLYVGSHWMRFAVHLHSGKGHTDSGLRCISATQNSHPMFFLESTLSGPGAHQMRFGLPTGSHCKVFALHFYSGQAQAGCVLFWHSVKVGPHLIIFVHVHPCASYRGSHDATAAFLTSTSKFNLTPNWWASENGPDHSLLSSKHVDAVTDVKTADVSPWTDSHVQFVGLQHQCQQG